MDAKKIKSVVCSLPFMKDYSSKKAVYLQGQERVYLLKSPTFRKETTLSVAKECCTKREKKRHIEE
jgi:hypothetical protein